MRRGLIITLALVALLALGAGTVMAQGPGPQSIPGPAGTFQTGFTVQNLGAAVANCNYQFFNSAGTSVYTSAPFTMAVGGSAFTYVPSLSVAAGQYSAVVSCDQQVAAVVNTSSGSSGGSYVGIDGARVGMTWYAPNAFSNYYSYNTNFVVQNATSSAVSVTIQIVDSTGAIVATQNNPSVPANAYVNFEQAGLAGMATNVAYSAKIIASGNVAVESNVYGIGTKAVELYSYTPFSGGSTTAYAPVIMKNYASPQYRTALTVQNLSASATVITVTYGTGLQVSQPLAGNASYVFFTPNEAGLANGLLTSAKVQSSGAPIVALVNETNAYHRAASYTGFAGGSSTVRAPIILKRYASYNTSVTCQNIGASATDITVTYSNGATSSAAGVAANGTALFYQPGVAGLPNGFNGSATIGASGGMPIVCIVNEDRNEAPYNTQNIDQLFAYEGMNQ